MVWTPVAKPTSSTWTLVSPQGKQTYDQADILYDDPNVFYDSINVAAWNNVAKPVSSVWTTVSKPT